MRAELAKLEAARARGTLRKESGMLRMHKKNIARLLTVLGELEGGPASGG